MLLLLLGSDLHMMERLTAYDRPFFGRADNMLLGPLNPAEVGGALNLPAADAIDAYLMSGGLPGILRAWPDWRPSHWSSRNMNAPTRHLRCSVFLRPHYWRNSRHLMSREG